MKEQLVSFAFVSGSFVLVFGVFDMQGLQFLLALLVKLFCVFYTGKFLKNKFLVLLYVITSCLHLVLQVNNLVQKTLHLYCKTFVLF